MPQMTYPRTPPQPPPTELWTAAIADFDGGFLINRTFTTEVGPVEASMTMTFIKSWQSLPLNALQRGATREACALIARDMIHPILGAQRCPLEPLGAWMASPYPDITITWRPHWDDEDALVLLTLTDSSAATRMK